MSALCEQIRLCCKPVNAYDKGNVRQVFMFHRQQGGGEVPSAGASHGKGSAGQPAPRHPPVLHLLQVHILPCSCICMDV